MTEKLIYDAFSGKRLSSAPKGCWSAGEDRSETLVVGPAFFDPQVNGFSGVDFQDPNLTPDGLQEAVQAIREAGCSHFLLTLITHSAEFLEEQFARIAGFLDREPMLRESILGFHLEGPFLSPKPGIPGAHPAEHLLLPDFPLFKTWQKASGNRIRMLTLAPELPGAIELISLAASEGIFICVGHTDASLEELERATGAGARMATHLGNGCPGDLHRHDNIIQRILSVPGLLASIIPDGVHVPPPAFSNLIGCLGPSRLVFTSDAVSAAGAPPGRYRVGPLEVTLGEDQVVMHPSGKSYAGSGVRMIDGFLNAIRFGGLGIEPAWRAWTRLRRIMFPEVVAPSLAIPFPQTMSFSARERAPAT